MRLVTSLESFLFLRCEKLHARIRGLGYYDDDIFGGLPNHQEIDFEMDECDYPKVHFG